MARPEIPERLRAYLAERSGLTTAQIEAYQRAERAFFEEHYPELIEHAAALLMQADADEREVGR